MISIIFLVASALGLKIDIIMRNGNINQIKFHTTLNGGQSTTSTSGSGFDLEHAINVHDNIHAHGNGNLRWQTTTVNHRGGTLGAYEEAVNIFNGTNYRIYEIYEVLVKAHPELINTKKEPYECEDLNTHYNMSVSYVPSNTSEAKKALQEGKLVQLQVHSNKWRNSKGEHVSWKGFHTGLIFHYDGTYFHMKAAGKINQWDSIYTESQLEEWIGNTHKPFIVYTKIDGKSISSPSSSETSSKKSIEKNIDFKLDDSAKQYKMTLNRVSQGCCFVGDDLIAVCDINVSTGGGNDNGTVCLYDRKTGKRYESSAVDRVGNHSNSMTFDPKTNKLLIATKGVDVYEVDLDVKKISSKKSHLDLKGHGIAYDQIKDTFTLVYGNKLRTYSREEFYGEKSPSKTSKYNYSPYNKKRASAQGLGAFGHLAFIPFSNKDSRGNYESNTILVFDLENGIEVTQLNTNYPHEIEDCMCSDNGELYCSDTMGNLFKTGINAYSDLGANRKSNSEEWKGGEGLKFPILPINIPKIPIQMLSSFITNIFSGNNGENASNTASSATTADEKYTAVMAVLERWMQMDGKEAHQEVIDAYNGYQDAHGKANKHMDSSLSFRNWCTETATACYAKAGYGDAVGGMSPTVGDLASNSKKVGAKMDKHATPKRGWIVCYKTSGHHTAVVDVVDGNKIKCIAGGTSKLHYVKIRKEEVKFYVAPFESNR